MKTSKDDESTQYSQSSCNVAGSSARFGKNRDFIFLSPTGDKNIKKQRFF